MAITGISAVLDVPAIHDVAIGTASATGTINVGDWLAYSGQYVVPTNAGQTAYWKASGAGVAIESNPVYDPAGRSVQNSGLRFVRMGVLRVSANFSGQPALGVGVYPDATGSGVAAPTGQTGRAATWQTSVKLSNSGATGAGGSGVAQVVGWRGAGNGGTGQLDVLLLPPRPDYY